MTAAPPRGGRRSRTRGAGREAGWRPWWLVGGLVGGLVAGLVAGAAVAAGGAGAAPVDLKRDYEFTTLDHEDGLFDDAVASIAQAADGRLWISSFNRLGCFDGRHFSGPGEVPAEAATRKVFVDPRGRLWAGARDRVLSYYEGRWTPHALPVVDGSVVIATFASAADRTLWAGGYGRLFRSTRGGFEAVAPPAGYREHDFFGLAADRAGTVWCCNGQQLAAWRGEGWEPVAELPADGAERFTGLCAARGGGLWVASRGEIRRWRDGAWEQTFSRPDDARGDELSLLEDARGNLWAGGWVSGVTVYSPAGEPTRWTVRDGLPANSVPQLAEDALGDVWVACNGGGLGKFRPRAARTVGVADGLEQIANSVAIDAAGRLLVGTHGSGLMALDTAPAGGRVRADERWAAGRFSSGVWVPAVAYDRDGGVWAGTVNEGLFHFVDGREEQFTEEALGSRTVFGLHEDRAGRLWVGTADGVAVRENGAFRVFGPESGLPRMPVHGFAEDAAGVLWVCGGAYEPFRLRNGRFEALAIPGMDSTAPVLSLLGGRDGTVWVGADPGGLARVRGDEAAVYGPAQGLPVMDIVAMVEDAAGDLWLGGSRKIVCITARSLDEVARGRRERLECRIFETADGVPGAVRARMQPAACRGPDGRIWFATLKGLAAFDPAALPPAAPPPPTTLRFVNLGGTPHEGITGASPPLRFESPERLEIGYSATSLAAPERVAFQRRLRPDEPWGAPDRDDQVQFRDLRPGAYRFEVRAAGSDGVWGEPAAVAFEVLPFFWQRWWFHAAWITAAAGAAALLVWRQLRALEAERRVQEDFSRRLLGREEALRKRMATDLHDSLGQTLQVIRNRAVLARRATPEPAVAEHAAAIADTASQAIGEMRAIVGNLHPTHLEHLGLSVALRQLAADTAHAGPREWETAIDPVDGLFSRDNEIHFYRIVQEALGNVLRHAAGDRAGLTIERLPEAVHVEIWDDGRGLPGGPDGAEARRFSGLGLRSMTERAAILGGSCRFLEAPQGGLLVVIDIPVARPSA